MEFYMPVKLITGAHCVRDHAPRLTALGSRCLIVTGATAAKRCGALEDVTAVLEAADISWQVYDKIVANPTMDSCIRGGALARELGADMVIGIGGGSALDAAKVIAVAAANPHLDAEGMYRKKWTASPLPLALVGTTAGTGSEVTPVAVLTDHTGKKRSIRDDCMYARLALGDPRYTLALPHSITASTGIDAVTHCTESYFSKKANHISRAMSLMGMERLLPPLRALAQGQTLTPEQRAELYDGSILAGLAICITGTVFPHNVGYYFSEHHGLPHGHACALLMPELLAHGAVTAPEYTADYFRKLGTTAHELTQLSQTLLPTPDITLSPDTIRAILPRWENNSSVMNTIGTVTTADIGRMLEEKFT